MNESKREFLPLKAIFALFFLLGFLSRAFLAPAGFDFDKLGILFLMIFCLLMLYSEQDKLFALLKFDEFIDREVKKDE